MRLTMLFFILSWRLQSQTIESTLPIVMINTLGQGIPDEFKVTASLRIIDNPDKPKNSTLDTANIYNGTIGIETRGSSSQWFPKKSYGFETRTSDGEDNEVSLFDWPKESDYILYASYNEKSLMNNVLTMKLSRDMGMYASRTRYVDVVLNGQYAGVYVLMEKVKRAKGRVDIAKLDSADIAGDELTGGYIIKIDKSTGTNLGSFFSKYNTSTGWVKPMFLYEAPKTIHSVQKTYIRNYVYNFEDALAGPNFKDADLGYAKYVDVLSFIRLFIINEVAGNVDGYRISTYLYKDKDSKNGKLTLGPPWDYDLAYGNADYCGAPSYTIFSYQFNERCSGDVYQVPFWWERLMQDSSFRQALYNEYAFQRSEGALQWSQIVNAVDSLKDELNQAQESNFDRWPVLGQQIWPNPLPIPDTWEGEINELLIWLENRLEWLDGKMEELNGIKNTDKFSIAVLNNPINENTALAITAKARSLVKINISDVQGQVLSQRSFNLLKGYNEINFLSEIMRGQELSRGLYCMTVVIGDERYSYKLVK